MRRLCLFAALTTSLVGAPSLAQSIEVGQLGSAEAYDVGTLDVARGGLDQHLWRGTSAARAIRLLSDAPTNSGDPVVRDLIRAVILSGGVPPVAADAEMETAYKKTRLDKIVAMGEMGSAQQIISRTPILQSDNQLQADMYLRAGNDEGTCGVADTVLEGRGTPKWARLRAYCHVIRGEVPAAELTADILRNSGYEDPTYFNLLSRISGGVGKPDFSSLSVSDPVHIALMTRAALSWPNDRPKTAAARLALSDIGTPEDRLVALYAAEEALSDAQMRQVLTSLAATDDKLAGAEPAGYEAALEADVPQGTAQLFAIAESGAQADRPKAVAEILKRADGAGAFERFSALLAPSISSLSPEEQVITNFPLFLRAAIARQDIGALRAFHSALGDRPDLQERVALMSDALGYGFLGGQLGIDVETRLAATGETKARAARDIFIALAMGATLSDIAEAEFSKASAGEGRSVDAGALAALQTASRAGGKAETALRAAAILNGAALDNWSLYSVIKSLGEAGLTRHAGRAAAADMLRDLPE